jgi:hypothetical protein
VTRVRGRLILAPDAIAINPRPRCGRAGRIVARYLATRDVFDRFVNGAGELETRLETGIFNTAFESSDVLAFNITRGRPLRSSSPG